MQEISPLKLRGMQVFKGLLTPEEQGRLVDDLRDVVREVPLFHPVTPSGKPMSVRMTSAGRFGWISDATGYRYSKAHPSGQGWTAIPDMALKVWSTVSGATRAPEACLINFYDAGAKMGLHQDRDEQDFTQPVVSISLGDEALFRVGNETRGGKTESLWLTSGDVVVMGGASRLLYHGIDRVKPQSSTLLPKGGRINLTLRVVT
ncbi:alpha-ketoglutarate-dependent dioxygenase AlkB family protein [Celeribacter halophilus]|uniref:Alkylated DNA repair protein (DNA oxidative demethylase) n=1 Tax=Celeribacter halophilus TaxID=576117 RepID=A0A1I3WAT6_9RHOB|nr:alpha-ketoglutarate-dependent dioxygenase AlkB [Celeribacter halophilus]PZX09362.1 alkylated DNA repair protein (DNA oxidative demethylase) [Celeribacter halophilus]SFK04303.1 alkylated DNA repair protein (DNA oxidative demethylase) [Celeribacter halophilus]